MSSDITFLVFAYNEEHRIEHMLRCLQGQGTIVVIDNFSTDRTLEIARRYTAEIYQHKNPGYIENEATMAFSLDKVRTRWAYLAYVDELIPAQLMASLKEIAAGNRYKIVEIYRRNFMYGREIYNYGKHHLRLFEKDAVDFRGNVVHKLGRYTVPPDQVYKVPKGLETSIWHFSSYNAERLELAHTRYANLEAKQRHDLLGQRFSGARALLKYFFYLFGTYFGLGGFRGGWPGVFISLQIAYFKLSIEARLWEYDNGVTPASIETEYTLLKEQLLAKYPR